MCLASCNDYDDTGLWNKVNGLEERIAALEEWQKTTDNNLNALQTLVNTMDYITSVAPIMQANDTIGYTINFYQSTPISIYNGTTSQIGITQDEAGNWLWTLDGEILTTPDGTPIPANGQDAAAPQLSTGKALQDSGIKTDAQGNAITADIAYLSVDGGETWYRVTGEKGDKGEQGDKGNTGSRGPAGADGDSFFKDVTVNDDDAVFTLANGTTFSIPLYTGIKLNFTQSSISLVYGDTETVPFTAEGSGSFTTDNLFTVAPYGWKAEVALPTRAVPSTDFILNVTAPDTDSEGEILVMLDNGQGNTTIGRLKVTAVKYVIDETTLTAGGLQVGGDLATIIGSRTDLTSVTVKGGTLDATDWEAIKKSKSSLVTIDLEGANYTGDDKDNWVYKGDYSNNQKLTTIKLPQGITDLGEYAFHGCSALTTVTLPEGLKSIGKSAFGQCSALKSIDLPETLTSIGDEAFQYSSLNTVTLPDKVTSIGDAAFLGCIGLESITLPEGLTSIGGMAFWNCIVLKSITLPETLTSIGNEAFEYCEALTTVICLATTPPALGLNAFYGCNALAAIYVPAESVDTYEAATYWSGYASIIQAIPATL